jgi:DNA primase large subunit
MDRASFYLFPLINVILKLIDDPWLIYQVANLVSKYFGSLMQQEIDDELLVSMARDQGTNIQRFKDEEIPVIRDISFPFYMDCIEYTKVAVMFRSPAWKMWNRYLKNGKVYLMTRDVARIVEETIKQQYYSIGKEIEERKKQGRKENSEWKKILLDNEDIQSFMNDILIIMKEKKKTSTLNKKIDFAVNENFFPPCLALILDKNNKGINLVHQERLFLTFFLLNIGMKQKDISKLFENQPDHDPKQTGYYIQHAAGNIGKKTSYFPHNCDKLQSYSICVKDREGQENSFCNSRYPVKNPIVYYKRMSRRQQYIQENNKNDLPGVKN